ncbi:MAG: cytochrome c3 family protein [Desulfosudaceae bacterium]
MKINLKHISLMAVLGVALACGLALASGHFPENITMEDKDAYERHTQGIVEFTHKKHFEEYEIGCGQCHHDENGKPLDDLEVGDDVQSCLDCHEAGRADRKALRDMSPEEREKEELKYHYGAIHQNCQGCHEEFNKEETGNARKGPAPVSCAKCHPRQER